MPRILASFVLAVALLGGGGAIAQPAAADVEEARKLSQQATADYKVGRFEDALTAYEAAYGLYKAPQFLFNIAQCHFQLERWDRAIFFFEGYLRELPEAPNRELVDDLMKEARARRAEQDTAAQRKLDLDKERLELAKREAERARERDRVLALQRVPEGKPVYKKWWFWTGVGAVVVGAAATTVLLSSGTTTILPEGSLGTWDRR